MMQCKQQFILSGSGICFPYQCRAGPHMKITQPTVSVLMTVLYWLWAIWTACIKHHLQASIMSELYLTPCLVETWPSEQTVLALAHICIINSGTFSIDFIDLGKHFLAPYSVWLLLVYSVWLPWYCNKICEAISKFLFTSHCLKNNEHI